MPTDLPYLGLPETRLFVYDEELVRESATKVAVLRIPIQDLTGAGIRKQISPFGLVCMAAGAAIGVITYEAAMDNAISVFMYVLSVLAILFGLLCIIETKLVLECGQDRHVIDPSESNDIVEGFVASLNQRIKAKR